MSAGIVLAVSQHGGGLAWAVAGACTCATALSGLRWLRVCQREHYLPDSASRFAIRWWLGQPVNSAGLVAALVGLVLAVRWSVTGFAPAVVVAGGPLGLGLRGRTSSLAWTRRLRTLAALWGLLQAVAVVIGIVSGYAALLCAAGALVVPAFVDVAATATAPIERRIGTRYVRLASQRLRRVAPKVVAITGSFGKTSTKGYVAHLLSGSMTVVASPASFNNRMGLARAVNENLSESAEVFVAEMGTYGRGEIAEMCSWMRPDIAVITAIGPVHLERFGSEDEIVRAKSEILAGSPCCVLMVDDERLAVLADAAAADGKQVWRCSASSAEGADVCVLADELGTEIWVRGARVGRLAALSRSVRPDNVTCAVAVALELGVPIDEVSSRLVTLPVAPHRLEPQVVAGGFTVLDDTYNSNPAGVRVALDALSAAAPGEHRRVVVTPGMVELGRRQAEENFAFAQEASKVATSLVVVGRTNRKALVTGFRSSKPDADGSLVVVPSREQAVRWVRANLDAEDAVLYENDLPDHYP
jgi:UDP-N-acetylmuramoyl-tripeptide--D-alanyl-D-alanine ligase